MDNLGGQDNSTVIRSSLLQDDGLDLLDEFLTGGTKNPFEPSLELLHCSDNLALQIDQNLAGQGNAVMIGRSLLPNDGVRVQLGLETGGPRQYQVGLEVHSAVAHVDDVMKYTYGLPMNIEQGSVATNIDRGAITEQTGNKSNKCKKLLSDTPIAIRSRQDRERKKDEIAQMKCEIEKLKNEKDKVLNENEKLKADCQLFDRLVDSLHKENDKMKKTCKDLANNEEIIQQLVINVCNLQDENLYLKSQIPFLRENMEKDTNNMLLEMYGKLKSENMLLKTSNTALSLQIMNNGDKKQEPIQGVATSSRN